MRASLFVLVGIAASANLATAQVTLNAFMTADNAFQASMSQDPNGQGSVFLSGNDWGSTYNATLPLNAPGTYYLHVLAQDFGDPASFVADLGLMNFQPGWSATFSNGQASLLSNTTNWIVSDQDFGVIPTVPVVINGSDGVGPWGDRPLISNNALNIWHPSNANSVYFTTVITVVPAPAGLAAFGLAGLAATRRRR